MKSRYVQILSAVLVGLQLLTCLLILRENGENNLDAAAVNKLIKECEVQWDQLQQQQADSLPEGDLDYAVLNNEGELLYSSAGKVSQTINAAIIHRDTIADIRANGETVGKVIVYNDTGEKQLVQNQKIIWLLIGSSGVTVIIMMLYLKMIHKKVITPFGKLKKFAAQVAAGDLNIPLEMDEGNIFGAFTESFDLMRDELKKAKQQERAANQSKKELVAQLSHDIKTPVASIKALSELMEVSAGTDKEKERLRVIGSKADQIDGLISNLFHATIAELEKLHVNAEEHSSLLLGDIIREADYLKKVNLGRIPECMLNFDRQRIQQVVDNIIVNSYKYAETEMEVDFSAAADFLTVRFKDRGAGVPAEELPLVTEKFYRGSNARGKSGTGLGLYTSGYLMEKMGGELICKNQNPGFEVTLILHLSGR